jgi:hypothetical protein
MVVPKPGMVAVTYRDACAWLEQGHFQVWPANW